MAEPSLSAILVTPDDWTNMLHTLAALRAQSIRERIELVFVGPSLSALDAPESAVEGFAALRKVAVPEMALLGAAYAAGVRTATAPLVAFTEDHCYPEPDWAEAFCRRHATGEWAGVGPTVINANPASTASWAQFIIEYGPYSEAAPKGPSRQIPGHNSCYRREELLKYELNLADWLNCETLLQWDMARRGLRLYLDPQVRTHHWNCSRMLPTLWFAWYFSREFAAYRVRNIAARERAKLALLWPLIPVVRLKRVWPGMTSLLGRRHAAAIFPAVAMNLLVSGAAEGLGYLTGKVGATKQSFDWEFHRERFLRRGEQLAVPVSVESIADPNPLCSRSATVAAARAAKMRPWCEPEAEPTWRD